MQSSKKSAQVGFSSPILIIIGLLAILVLGGGLIFLKSSKHTPNNQSAIAQTPLPSSSPKTMLSSDLSDITNALAAKLNRKPENLIVSITQDSSKYNGNFAAGEVNEQNVAGGGRWIAAKVNGKWVIANEG